MLAGCLKKFREPLLLCAIVSVYWSSIFFNNTFDWDEWDILRSLRAPGVSIWTFFSPHNEHFTPLFNLMYYINLKLFGMNFFSHKLVAFSVFILNILMIYFLIKLMLPDHKKAPFAAALFFSLISYLHDVVYWQMLYCFLLSFLFMTASLYFLYLGFKERSRSKYWLSVLFAFMSPLSFTSGLIVYPMALFLYYLMLKRDRYLSFAKDFVLSLPFILSFAAYSMMYYFFSYSNTMALINMTAGTYHRSPINLDPIALLKIVFVNGFIQGALVGVLGGHNQGLPAPLRIAHVMMILIVLYFLVTCCYYLFRDRRNILGALSDDHRALFYFGLIGAFLNYLFVALIRSNQGIEKGRYNYFPYLFLILMAIGAWPIFDRLIRQHKKRFLGLLAALLFLLFVMVHQAIIEDLSTNKKDACAYIKDFEIAAASVNAEVDSGNPVKLVDEKIPATMHPNFDLSDLYLIFYPKEGREITWMPSKGSNGAAVKSIHSRRALADFYKKYYGL